MSGVPAPGSKLRAPSKLQQPASKLQKPGAAKDSTDGGASKLPVAGGDGGKKTSTIPSSKAAAVPATPRKAAPGGAFKVGDAVVSSGKRGVIRFLGTAQFAPGEWAGIELLEAQGKNDGTVQGVRYFQCRANHGLFAKPDKLERDASAGRVGKPPPAAAGVAATPARPSAAASAMTSGTRTPSARKPSVSSAKVGDRVVLVNGAKQGVLRYLGTADFAAGQWAGVELEKPEGKNDGTVQGKRYFQCPPNHGLFSPAHKIEILESSSPLSRASSQADLRASAAQLAATASPPPSSMTAAAVSSGGMATPVSTATAAAAELTELEAQVETLREQLEKSEHERQTLSSKLNEEERKVEDMQFQFEEQLVSAGGEGGASSEDLQRARDELSSVREQLATSDELREHLEKRNEALAEQVEQAGASGAAAAGDSEALLTELAAVKAREGEERSRGDRLATELNSEKDKSTDLHQQLQTGSRLAEEMTATLATLQAQVSSGKKELVAKTAQFEAQVSAMTGDSGQQTRVLREELDARSAALAAARDECARLQQASSAELETLRARATGAEATSAEASARHASAIGDLEARLNAAEEQRLNLDKSGRDAEEGLAAAARETDGLRQAVETHKQELASSAAAHSQAISEKEAEVARLVASAQQQQQLAEQTASELEARLNAAEEQRLNLDKSGKDAEEGLAAAGRETDGLRQAVETHKQELASSAAAHSQAISEKEAEVAHLVASAQQQQQLAEHAAGTAQTRLDAVTADFEARISRMSGDSSDQVRELEAELTRARAERQALADEAVALEASLQQQGASVTELQASAGVSAGQLADVALQLASWEQRWEGEHAKHADVQAALRALQKEHDGAQASLAENRGEVVAQQSRANTLAAELESASAQIAARTGELAALQHASQESRQQLEERLRQREEALESARRELETSAAGVVALTTSREQLTGNVADLQRDLDAGTEQVTSLTQTLGAVQAEVAAERHARASLEEALRQARDDKVLLQTQLDEVAKASGNSSEQLTYLNDQLRDKDAAIDAVRQEKSAADVQLATALSEAAAASAAHADALARERETAGRALTETEERVAQLERLVAESRAGAEQQLVEVREDAARERARAGDAAANAEQQMLVLTENCADSQARCAALQQQVRQYESAQANLRSESDQLRELLTTSQSEVVLLREERAAMTVKFDALIADRESVANERRDLAMELESQRRNAESLDAQLRTVSLENEEASASLVGTREELSELIRAHETASQQLAAAAADRTALQETCESMQTKLMALSAGGNEVAQRLADCDGQRLAALDERDLVVAQLQSSEMSLSASREDLDAFRSNLNLATEKLDRVQQELGEAREEKRTLTARLSDAEQSATGAGGELEAARASLAATNQELVAVTTARDGLQAERDGLASELRTFSATLTSSGGRLEETQRNYAAAEQRIAELDARLLAASEQEQAAKAESLEQLRAARQEAEGARADLEARVAAAQNQVTELRSQLAAAAEETSAADGELRSSVKNARAALAQAQGDKARLEEERNALVAKLETDVQDWEQRFNQAQSQVADSQQAQRLAEEAIANSQAGSSSRVNDLEMDLRLAQQAAEIAQGLLGDKEAALSAARQESGRLQESVHAAQSGEDTLRAELKAVRRQLLDAQQEAVNAAAATQTSTSALRSAPSGDAQDGAVSGDLEALESSNAELSSQVDFLNSVIVDLQAKFEEKRKILAALEEAGIDVTSFVDNDDSLEQMKFAMSSEDAVSNRPSRIFCDICEVFDQHDTDDCPTQASEPVRPESQNRVSRHAERPFCDNCEVFGHWTEDCKEEETF